MNKLSGYTQIEIGGKKRPFKMGMNASYLICEELKIPLEKLGDALSNANIGKNVTVVLWAGLYAGCKTDKIPVDFDRWDVGDWVDEFSKAGSVNQLMASLSEINENSFPKEKASKKKMRGKR